MGSTKQYITLQFGSFANYVGAHYWNFQDELLGLQELEETQAAANQVDLSTVYRAGETPQGEPTYTPRLVLFDLKGSLGGVGSQGMLYADDASTSAGRVATWGGRAVVHRTPAVPRSGFLQQLEEEAEGEEPEGGEPDAEQAGPSPLDLAARQLDSAGGVRYFTDFLKAHLHPRSIFQLEGMWQGVAEFGGWGDGVATWQGSGAERREEMSERIRYFAEECDSLQGFQVLVDDLSGFGNLACQVLQEINDDYGGRPVMLFAVRPEAEPEETLPHADQRRHWLNEALSHSLLTQHCSSYTALAPPAVHSALPALRWQGDNLFHASAICAAAFDTATLPYRLAGGTAAGRATGGMDMWALTQLLTAQHPTPLSALSVALPAPTPPANLQQEQQQADARLEHQNGSPSPAAKQQQQQQPFTRSMTACLTPGMSLAGAASEAYAESVVLRGPRSAEGPVYLPSAGAALDAALLQEGVRCVRQRTLLAQPLPIPLPFPSIFGSQVSPLGVLGRGMPRGTASVASCPVLSRLSGTAAFQPVLQRLQREFKAARAVAQGQAMLEGWGYGREEAGEVSERLANLAAAYEEGDEFL